jgi:hypothetical protein
VFALAITCVEFTAVDVVRYQKYRSFKAPAGFDIP